ncbi:MAG TPA: chemotaxis response regulator protein-glutamate methylesterase [Fimbriiglobus sp.]|jgi:two-component system chemotaxis response regulator CheB
MPRIRVLIVDDSAVIRRVVMEELSADPAIEVVGTASNGKIALARLPQVGPDLVILDVEMPEMDGLATLKALRKDYPRLPVIMFSAVTERGASATLDALTLGATDYFTKPAGPGGIEDARRVIREELIPEIRAICAPKSLPLPPPAPTGVPALPNKGRIEVVVVGLSTGGPNALAEVFAGLPAQLPVPILIVQHMPPMFTRLLAERLAAATRQLVAEAEHGADVLPGRTLIARGDYHMTVARDGLRVRALLDKDPPENSCRPAVDPLFRSAAAVYRSGVLAVVLTGMGRDGLRGCEVVREAGGQILAQDEATSVVWGMPGYVARAGLADKVLPLSAIAGEIARRVGSARP